jgi:hypothetical protein
MPYFFRFDHSSWHSDRFLYLTPQRKNVHVFFDYLPQEDHATIMHQAVLNAFKLIYSKAGKK